MTTQTAVTSTSWIKVANSAQDFDAYLVDENTGSGNGADVRVVQAVSLPDPSYPAINGRRAFGWEDEE